MADAAPIGIFDSGVGGLSVLREVRTLLPGRAIVYLADNAFSPYGSKTLEEVRRRAVAITRFLRDEGAESIVLACNTASAAALHHLRDLYPDVSFVGMEPAVKPAANLTDGGVVGVLATPATFQGALYASVVDRHGAGVEIVEAAAAGLARAIDEGDDEEAERILGPHVEALCAAGVDRIVLACTHYSFVADRIQALTGPGVVLIDPAPAVARQVARVAGRGGRGGTVDYLTTGDPEQFASRIEGLLRERVSPRAVGL